ncbi:MAG: tetratricopeptide repeat protein [Microthrixaceae bacterium]
MNGRRLDPDELALLEEERDHLLVSLQDLEREHDAGDLDDLDYATLRDDYTVRASEVLAAIEEQRSWLERERAPRRRGRTIASIAGVVVLAVAAGVLVAQASGQRGGGAITGAVDTNRARLQTCQQASFQDPEGGVECYDDLLADAPDNVEALTYQGWALVRLDRVDEGAAQLARAVELDPDYPDARVFRAVVAARGGNYELAAAEIDRFYRNDPSPAAIQVLQTQGIEREIFVFTINETTRACWQESARNQDPEATDAEAFLDELAVCLEALLEREPGNVDAMVSLAYAGVDQADPDLRRARELAAAAIAADPQDPNALLLSASLAFAEGQVEETEAALALLGPLPRPTASFLFGGPEQLRSALDAATAVTTTTAPTTIAPTETPSDGPSRVPNPDGG